MPTPNDDPRWSDKELAKLRDEFHQHLEDEAAERDNYRALHDAVFRIEDKDKRITPGLLQLCSRMADDLHTIKVAHDRQKIAVAAVMSTLATIWFIVADVATVVRGFFK